MPSSTRRRSAPGSTSIRKAGMRGGKIAWWVLAGLILGTGGGFLLGPSPRKIFESASPGTLAERTRLVEMEYPLAASRKPYLLLNLPAGRLDFRISGVTAKSIPVRVEGIESGRAGGEIGSNRLTLLTLRDRGAPPDVIHPPDPNVPVDPLKDPRVFPPDPPTEYKLSFEPPTVQVRIKGIGGRGVQEVVRTAGSLFRGLLEGRGGSQQKRAWIGIRVPTERAQEIYRALYRGEKVVVVGFGE